MNRLCLALTLFAAIFAAACGGGGSTPIPPPPVGNFSNASLKGQYSFSMSGQDGSTGLFFARIGSFIADGNGNITGGIEDVNLAGAEESLAFTPSTYTVQANGHGALNLINSTGTLSFSITLLSATQGLIAQTDGFATASGTFVIQNTGSFNTAGISGNYAFDFSGVDPAGLPDSIIGQLVSNGSGGLGGLLDENDNASTSGAAPITGGSYQMDATNGATFGRGTASFTANGFTFNYVFYIVNNSRFLMIESGVSAGLTVGAAASQSSVPTSNATFNGDFAFLASGTGLQGGLLTRIGRFTADGNGGLGKVFADTNDNGTVAQVPSSNGALSATTYAIDTTNAGTGRGILTFTDSHLGKFQFVFYLSSPSTGVIQDVSANNVADGTVQLQTGAPFSNSSLAGDYGFTLTGLSSNNNTGVVAEEDFVGQLAFSTAASNNVTGIVDFSEFSSNQGVFLNVVLSGNGLTVGGDGTTSSGTRNTLALKPLTSPSATINFVAYFVDSQHMFVAGTDSNRVISGVITMQAP